MTALIPALRVHCVQVAQPKGVKKTRNFIDDSGMICTEEYWVGTSLRLVRGPPSAVVLCSAECAIAMVSRCRGRTEPAARPAGCATRRHGGERGGARLSRVLFFFLCTKRVVGLLVLQARTARRSRH